MITRRNKVLLSFGKYLLWTTVAAVITALINIVPTIQAHGWHIPDAVIPLIGGLLKSWATYAATEADECRKW